MCRYLASQMMTCQLSVVSCTHASEVFCIPSRLRLCHRALVEQEEKLEEELASATAFVFEDLAQMNGPALTAVRGPATTSYGRTGSAPLPPGRKHAWWVKEIILGTSDAAHDVHRDVPRVYIGENVGVTEKHGMAYWHVLRRPASHRMQKVFPTPIIGPLIPVGSYAARNREDYHISDCSPHATGLRRRCRWSGNVKQTAEAQTMMMMMMMTKAMRMTPASATTIHGRPMPGALLPGRRAGQGQEGDALRLTLSACPPAAEARARAVAEGHRQQRGGSWMPGAGGG